VSRRRWHGANRPPTDEQPQVELMIVQRARALASKRHGPHWRVIEASPVVDRRGWLLPSPITVPTRIPATFRDRDLWIPYRWAVRRAHVGWG
jgi:hypothetical protein